VPQAQNRSELGAFKSRAPAKKEPVICSSVALGRLVRGRGITVKGRNLRAGRGDSMHIRIRGQGNVTPEKARNSS